MKKTVVITGVLGGIGSATAQLFHESGWKVIGIDLRSSDSCAGVDHLICEDVSDPESSSRIFQQIGSISQTIHSVINNAAIQICKPLVETSIQEWDHVMGSNVRSIYLTVRNAFPAICRKTGSIVNISSVHALASSAGIAAYATSKGAVLTLTRALAAEMSAHGIRVNAVLPGAVDTEMLKAGLARNTFVSGTIQTRLENLALKHTLGRIGQPSEIAQAILFLADSSRSSFITGQALIVDGGATAKLSTE